MTIEPYAAVAETHISTVFFAGDRAYKLLKPLRTGFLDHSTVERRKEACDREVALNRRLAPDVYLGTGTIVENDRVADHLIVMRRLPPDRRLAALLGTDEQDPAIRSVARAVAVFHAAQPPDARAAHMASSEGVANLWASNFDEMRHFGTTILPSDVLADVEALATDYVAGRVRLFADRIAAGFARDGHGDLLADDIFCLDDGPRIIDCLAFDDDLRVGDVLLDVAFLVMDLERLAGLDVAASFLSQYQAYADEHHPASLAHHYVAYRALVRCKVNALRSEQGSHAAVEDARRHLEMTYDHLLAGRPRLVIVGGAPGTGKTTVATAAAARCGFALLSSDEMRKDLAGIPHHQHAFADQGQGIYSQQMTDRTYAELVRRAQELLESGESVVVDASWTTTAMRDLARAAASRTRSDLVELRCVLDPLVASERIEHRLAHQTSPSDATPAIARSMADAADPWPEATLLDTSAGVEAIIDLAAHAIGPC